MGGDLLGKPSSRELSVSSYLAIMEDQVAQRGNVELVRTVFALQLPRAVVLGLLPAAIKLIHFLLTLGFDLYKTEEKGQSLKERHM